MASYTADQIVGKVLIAAQRVPIKSLPYDNADVINYVEKGSPIGKVYSFLNRKTGRSNVYWMFYDKNEVPYYVEHKKSYFDSNTLLEQMPKPEETWMSTATGIAGKAIAAWIGVKLVTAFVSSNK